MRLPGEQPKQSAHPVVVRQLDVHCSRRCWGVKPDGEVCGPQLQHEWHLLQADIKFLTVVGSWHSAA